MQIPPKYEITPEMLSLIAKIDANREFIVTLNPPQLTIEKIHSISLLKSSLYSARIEGHQATFEELDEKEKNQLEIFNILKAIKYIKRKIKTNTKISKSIILKLHQLTMNGVASDAGKFRTEMSAIFNQAGIAIYLPPPPTRIDEYLLQLFEFINKKKEPFPLLSGFISHLIFEKIHPFLDGNGRVGRLLIDAIFQSNGYNFGIHIPVEEYIDAHKDGYYYALDIGLQKPDEYLLFMLEAFYEQTERTKELVLHEQKNIGLFVTPRQEEIYRIITDHKVVSLDFIKRRFLKVPERTIRYDLKKMSSAGLIVKIGKTRGVYYAVSRK